MAAGASVAVLGREVVLPVVVRDAATMSASFLVSAAAAREVMGEPRLALAEPLPGRAVCVLAAVEYRDNDLGRYNEVAVAFLVRHGGSRLPLVGTAVDALRGRLGAYIHWLPVTTDFSCAAGRDVWGFPKTVAEIEFADADCRRTCRLSADGAHVLTLTVARGGRRPMPETRLAAWATRDGILRRTPFVSAGEGLGVRLGGAALELGSHPRAEELRRLGLPRRAVMTTSVEHLRARFEAAVPVEGSPG
jgi:hypothetical protein